MVGFILAVVWFAWRTLVARAPRFRTAAAGLGIVLIAVMAAGTCSATSSEARESLWLDATDKSPDNGRGLMNYGVIQMNKGNYRVANQLFERALVFAPNYAYLHVDIGVLEGGAGRPAEAERHFREAQTDDPTNPVSYTFFARWLRSVGRTEEARLFGSGPWT